jgi:hypothetical protein
MSGPKSDSSTIDSRRGRLLELLSEGNSQVDCVTALEVEGYPVSRMTLYRDVKALQVQWEQSNQDSWVKMRDEQLTVLRKMEDSLLNQVMTPAEVDTWRKVRKDIADLVGLDAPSKTISARVDVNADQSRYSRIMRACRGIFAEDRWNQIITYLSELPRDDNPFPTVGRIIEQKVIANE